MEDKSRELPKEMGEGNGRSRNVLDRLFTEAIAKRDNVAGAKITAGYIEEQREKKIYPHTKMDEGSHYGGHSGIGLKFYTGNQKERVSELVDELMSHV